MLERDGASLNITDRGWSAEELSDHIGSLSEDQRNNVDMVYGFGNKLTELPDALYALPKATGFYFGKNRLRRVPRDLPTRLRDLFLFDNDIATLPSTMTKLTALKALDLRGNMRLPEHFRVSTYSHTSTAEMLAKIGTHYAQVEERHQRCRRAALLMVALRRLHRSPYVVQIDIAVMRLVAAEVWALRDSW